MLTLNNYINEKRNLFKIIIDFAVDPLHVTFCCNVYKIDKIPCGSYKIKAFCLYKYCQLQPTGTLIL